MIPQSFIQDLLNRIDIVDVVGKYVQLKKGGANLLGLCPFHNEKSPSFTVSPAKQFYHCFGCGLNGTAIGFLMEYSGLGFVEAVEDLAQSIGVAVPDDRGENPVRRDGPNFAVLTALMESANGYYKEQLKISDIAKQYLIKRGLTGEVARDYGLGYAPDEWNALQSVFGEEYSGSKQIAETGLTIDGDKGRRYDRFRGRVMFPIRNSRGAIIGFGGRVIGDGEPKYLNSPETPLFEKGLELYGLFEARKTIRNVGRVLVVEGYMDVVALAQHDVGYAVATLGTACTPAHVQKLTKQADLIIFCFDGDAAGRRAAWRALENCLSLTDDGIVFRFLFLPPEHDPDTFIRERGREAFQTEEERAWPLSVFLLNHLKADVDLGTSEGRAGLVHAVKPHLQRITAPALRLSLVKEVAELTNYTPNEVEKIAELALQASKFEPRVPRAPVTPSELHILRLLVRLPRLGCSPIVEESTHAIPENSLTRRIIEIVEANEGVNSSAALLEFFRDTEDEVVIKEAIKHALGLEKSDEMVELEFYKTLANPEIAWIDARLASLAKSIVQAKSESELAELPELKDEYRTLQARRESLKFRLKGESLSIASSKMH